MNPQTNIEPNFRNFKILGHLLLRGYKYGGGFSKSLKKVVRLSDSRTSTSDKKDQNYFPEFQMEGITFWKKQIYGLKKILFIYLFMNISIISHTKITRKKYITKKLQVTEH
jgi:hypothetical protein